ncbi:MAG: hypothetical protein MMC33_010205 [Icmadophila ericetorum]|nr:hypothetical protein [Icmadophila ericetorum]
MVVTALPLAKKRDLARRVQIGASSDATAEPSSYGLGGGAAVSDALDGAEKLRKRAAVQLGPTSDSTATPGYGLGGGAGVSDELDGSEKLRKRAVQIGATPDSVSPGYGLGGGAAVADEPED